MLILKVKDKMAKQLNIEEVMNKLQEVGYTLASSICYKNAHQQLPVICKNGHKRTMTMNRLRKKQMCALCLSENKKTSLDDICKILSDEGYFLLGQYISARKKLELLCPIGHVWLTTINKFKSGRRCSSCTFNGGSSRAERELLSIIHSFYPSAKKSKRRNIKINRRPYIRGLDIDIYIPELNSGIEFDSTYYHSIAGLRRSYPNWPDSAIKNYHKIKDDYFLDNGIKLLHIKEQDWLKNKRLCINRCLSFLSKQARIQKKDDYVEANK